MFTGGTDRQRTMQGQSCSEPSKGRNILLFCVESVQLWVLLSLGRLIGRPAAVIPVPEKQHGPPVTVCKGGAFCPG